MNEQKALAVYIANHLHFQICLPIPPGVLTIPGASVEDSGVYVCTASGVQGTFTLSVLGKLPLETHLSRVF